MTERGKAEAALLAVTMVWGASFTLVKGALGDASTVAFLAVRFTLATATLALFSRRALATGMLADPLAWQGAWRASLCLVFAYLFQTSGLRLTTPSKSAFLTALSAVLVPLLGACIYRTVPRAVEIAGVLLASAGVALLAGSAGGPVWQQWGPGDLLTLGGAVLFAGHILVTGHYAGKAGLGAFSLLQLGGAAVLFWAAVPWIQPFALRFTPRLATALLVTSVLCTAVAFTVQAWAQRHTTATRAGLIFASEPVAAAATSYFVAGEILPPAGLLGAALILAGLLVVELNPRRQARAAAA